MLKKDGYKLADFSEKEKEVAKRFIAEAIKSFVSISADKKVETLFDQIKNTSFDGEDQFEFNFGIKTIGNDLITAIGAAKRKIGKKGGGRG